MVCDIFKQIYRPKGMRGVGHVACTGKMKTGYKILARKRERKRPFVRQV
jgi:hypothetical protein